MSTGGFEPKPGFSFPIEWKTAVGIHLEFVEVKMTAKLVSIL